VVLVVVYLLGHEFILIRGVREFAHH